MSLKQMKGMAQVMRTTTNGQWLRRLTPGSIQQFHTLHSIPTRSQPNCLETNRVRALSSPIRCPIRSIHQPASTAEPPATRSGSIPSQPNLPPIPLFEPFNQPTSLKQLAITHGETDSFTYQQLLDQAQEVAARLQSQTNLSDLRDIRVAFLYPSSFEYVSTLYGIWLAGGIAVPLHAGHAKPELEYLIHDSGARIVMVGSELRSTIESLPRPKETEIMVWNSNTKHDQAHRYSSQASHHHVQMKPVDYRNRDDFLKRRAMFIYTSGTTGKPKGVVWTHLMFETQLSILSQAWKWSSNDHILHVLPLHHVHGVVNVLLCALYNHARVTFLLGKFTTDDIGRALLNPNLELTLFMAVPTIYSRLLTYVSSLSIDEQSRFHRQCSLMRLMVSGSAALPAPILHQWQTVSGQLLLERYGMSEIGMALSQTTELEERRKMIGTVGRPLPTVETKIVPVETDANTKQMETTQHDVHLVGELRVRGPSVFTEYWNLPDKTRSEFDADGWFKTGDIVEVNKDTGYYRILGRSSVDVLKSAGYKISALDVERELLSHPEISECAVVGVPDQEYGQIVGVIIVFKPGSACSSSDSLMSWCRTRLASYQVPRLWRIVSSLPRNAMGKTNKKELVKIFQPNQNKQP